MHFFRSRSGSGPPSKPSLSGGRSGFPKPGLTLNTVQTFMNMRSLLTVHGTVHTENRAPGPGSAPRRREDAAWGPLLVRAHGSVCTVPAPVPRPPR